MIKNQDLFLNKATVNVANVTASRLSPGISIISISSSDDVPSDESALFISRGLSNTYTESSSEGPAANSTYFPSAERATL